MAIQHYYPGPAVVEVALRTPGSDTLGAYTSVGVNREAIPIVIQPKFLDVPSDDWAGGDGAPSDAQFMGAIATVQLSMTKFERALADRLLDGLMYSTNTAGAFPAFGSFIRLGGFMFGLRLNSQQTTKADEKMIELPYCFARSGGAVGQGTRYSSYDLTIECWLNNNLNRQLYQVTYA